jgi:hypothetical protein
MVLHLKKKISGASLVGPAPLSFTYGYNQLFLSKNDNSSASPAA